MNNTKVNNYQIVKENARQKAIDWQDCSRETSMSWGELAYWQEYFEKLGKRYGLLTEFRENCIC
jgi:hypothetical protein